MNFPRVPDTFVTFSEDLQDFPGVRDTFRGFVTLWWHEMRICKTFRGLVSLLIVAETFSCCRHMACRQSSNSLNAVEESWRQRITLFGEFDLLLTFGCVSATFWLMPHGVGRVWR